MVMNRLDGYGAKSQEKLNKGNVGNFARTKILNIEENDTDKEDTKSFYLIDSI